MSKKDQTPDSRPRIGILVGHQLAKTYGEGHVLCDLQEMLSDHLLLDLVGGGALDQDITRRFDNHNYLGIRPLGHPLLNAALWPMKFINCMVYVLKKKPDALFNIGSPGVLGLIATLTGKLLGVPVGVRTPGNTLGMHRHQKRPLRKLKALVTQRYFCKASLAMAKLVLTLGDGLGRELERERIPKEKIRIIPQPVHIGSFSSGPGKAPARQKLGLDAHGQVALFVGRLEAEKGTDMLLEVARSALRQGSGTLFLVVGAGPLKHTLENEPNIRLEGFIQHRDMPLYYDAADVLVSTSHSEGVPNVMLEAMAAGLPVLSTPSSDEIRNMVTNICETETEFVDRLSRRDYAVDPLPPAFDWDRMRADYLAFFKELTA